MKRFDEPYDRKGDKKCFESLVLPADKDGFVVIMCCGYKRHPWRVFFSNTGKWITTTWPTTGAASNTVFADKVKRQAFFVVAGEDKKRVVHIPK